MAFCSQKRGTTRCYGSTTASSSTRPHERSLNIDFILGYLRRTLEKRNDLKVIISSATLDAGSFSEFFDDAPVIEVEGPDVSGDG